MSDLATIDAPPQLRESVSQCVNWSQTNAIVCAEDFTMTAGHLQEIKSRQKAADEFFDPVIQQAHQVHKALVARKKLITDPLLQSEALDKRKMLTYQQAEQEKAEAQRRKLQAEADEKARIERAKAEAEAAKQRAIEAEARAVAERARLAAEQASAEERKKLLAEAAKADKKADAAAVKVEAKTEQAANVVAPVVHVQTVAPKVSGISTKKNWTFRITDQSLIPREFLIVDEPRLKKYAGAMKEMAKVPGIVFFTEESLSSRAAPQEQIF